MMHRFFISVAMLTGAFCAAQSQELASKAGVTITSSSKILKEKMNFLTFEYVDENGFVAKFKKDGEYQKLRFDQDLKEDDFPAEVISYDEGAEKEYTRPFSFKGKYYLLRGTVNREAKTNVFSQVEITKEGKEIGEPTIMAKIVGDEFYAGPGNANFLQKYSPDGNKLLVLLKMPEKRIDDGRLFTIYRYFVYDENMKLLWNKEVEFKHDGGRVIAYGYNTNYFFENDGTVLAWGILDRGRKVEEGTSRFAFRFYGINGDGVNTTEVNLEEKMDSWRAHYANDRVYLFDTYGVDKGEGFRVVTWNSKEKEAKINYLAFGKEHLIKNQPEKEEDRINKLAEKGKPVFAVKFNFMDVLPTAEGGFVLTGQEGFTKVTQVDKFTKYNEYFRWDYHLMGVNAAGEKTWSDIVPLDQKTTGGEYGCLVKPVKDKVYVIFHDSYSNLEPGWKPGDKLDLYKGQKTGLGLVVIDTKNPNAMQKRHLLCRFEALGSSWISPESSHTSKYTNSSYMYDYLNKEHYRFLRFDFE